MSLKLYLCLTLTDNLNLNKSCFFPFNSLISLSINKKNGPVEVETNKFFYLLAVL
jgi:hypothetical protein